MLFTSKLDKQAFPQCKTSGSSMTTLEKLWKAACFLSLSESKGRAEAVTLFIHLKTNNIVAPVANTEYSQIRSVTIFF